jgi:DNA-binding MarR family transcriptional regulator
MLEQDLNTRPATTLGEQLKQVGDWLIGISQGEFGSQSSDHAVPELVDLLSLLGSRPRAATGQSSDEPLFARLATEEYRARERRDRLWDGDLFGEPAWDMLLDLYIAGIAGRRLSITSLCYGARVPTTTALRWIKMLEDRGMLIRTASETDRRVFWVQLTEHTHAELNSYFKERLEKLLGIASGLGGRR